MEQVEDVEQKGSQQPRWKWLVWSQLVVVLVWLILKNLPTVQSVGAGGAVDLLLVVLVILVSLVWLLFFSRLSWRFRWVGLAGMLLLPALIKVDGHTGSFFPQFSWRWSKNPATEIPELTGKVADEGTMIETEGAANFPRFLGGAMSNWVSGELLPADWFDSNPKELWRRKIGEGWSSFSVAGGFAYTMEQLGDLETTICYELETGDPVWVHRENVRFEESMGDDGPRSTPTVSNGRVLSFGATGILNCLDARTGDLIWGKNVLSEVSQDVPQWAKSCSPLVVDGKVIVTLGSQAEKNLAAFDLASGSLLWKSGDYSSSYASPVVANLCGKKQIVAIQQKAVAGYEIETGKELWSFSIGNPQSNCASPLIVGDTVVTSSGYGYGTHRIEIKKSGDEFQAEELWFSQKLKSKFADMVLKDGYLYGLNDGRMVCLNLEDGKLAWRGDNYGHGQILGVGEHMVVQGETGEIFVLELNPDDEEVVTEFDALDHRTWNHPVLAGRILLVRNDREAIAFKF